MSILIPRPPIKRAVHVKSSRGFFLPYGLHDKNFRGCACIASSDLALYDTERTLLAYVIM